MCKSDFSKILFTPVLLLFVARSAAQCPVNIGFENGTFQKWEISEGYVSKIDGSVLTQKVTSSSRVTILQNTYPQALDKYGQFPVNSPNGSNYSVKLGDNLTGGHAQTVSYTFTIPANQNSYSIIYNYAVVLQNPPHASWLQPGFFSKVFDVSSNQYIDCGAFNFVASSDLPGFQLSHIGSSIYYKPWSPITVKLIGYAGKTIRLEFTSHDCAPGGHFGYAYLDVNENCSSPVSGNVFCKGSNSVTLIAPFGFSSYAWYNSDYSQILGTSNILKLTPPPPAGTLFHVVVFPYPGLGCLDTLNTTIQSSPQTFKFQTVDSIVACVSDLVDITKPFVTAGSSDSLTFSYYIDTSQTNYEPTPKYINSAGTFYIKAVNGVGCSDLKPVIVKFASGPNFKVNSPLAACYPNKADITTAVIDAGSDTGVIYSYWKDSAATLSLPNPQLIDANGTYFIKANNSGICFTVKPVNVIVSNNPVLAINNPTACGSVNITSPIGFISNQTDITSTFWQDSAATKSIALPDSIKLSGTYYVRAKNTVGCSTIAAIQAIVFPIPYFTISQAPVVTLPTTIDLSALIKSTTNTISSFSYWQDSAETISVANPNMVASSGVYYIKATSADGCVVLDSTQVTVNESPVIPPNAFSPNNDGINDTWDIPLLQFYPQCTVDIYNRYGQIVFHSIGYTKPWDGKMFGKDLSIGTYYYIIKLKQQRPPLSGSISIIR